MSHEDEALVQRWIDTFHEPPVLVDRELMEAFIGDAESAAQGEP